MCGTTNKKTDEVGPSLLPPEKAKSEKEVHERYAKQFIKLVLIQGPIIAWSIYLIATFFFLSERSKELIEQKLKFLRQYDLQYLYYAVFMIYLVRLPMVANANGARGPTRLDRPDQHIYQVVGSKDLVMMATDGVHGRFNRAQRAIMNMDEGIPLFLANTLLVTPILGQVACFFLIPLYAYGRIKFAHDYKASLKGRLSGFLFCMIAEHGMASFVGLIAVKAAFGDIIPV